MLKMLPKWSLLKKLNLYFFIGEIRKKTEQVENLEKKYAENVAKLETEKVELLKILDEYANSVYFHRLFL